MKHLKYLSYVLRHKWFVFVECCREGIVVRGLLHDWHKFLPSEWTPYANHFYGDKDSDISKGRDSTGYYKPTDTGDSAFDFAWLLHQKRADHHWQWWVLPEDDGGVKVLPMTYEARLEMIASKAQGHGGWAGVAKWYDKNKSKMQLHAATRRMVESMLRLRVTMR